MANKTIHRRTYDVYQGVLVAVLSGKKWPIGNFQANILRREYNPRSKFKIDFMITGKTQSGVVLPTISVPLEDFENPSWILTKWLGMVYAEEATVIPQAILAVSQLEDRKIYVSKRYASAFERDKSLFLGWHVITYDPADLPPMRKIPTRKAVRKKDLQQETPKSSAKKATAKRAPSKKATAKKATAKKAPAKKATAKKAPAKRTTAKKATGVKPVKKQAKKPVDAKMVAAKAFAYINDTAVKPYLATEQKPLRKTQIGWKLDTPERKGLFLRPEATYKFLKSMFKDLPNKMDLYKSWVEQGFVKPYKPGHIGQRISYLDDPKKSHAVWVLTTS